MEKKCDVKSSKMFVPNWKWGKWRVALSRYIFYFHCSLRMGFFSSKSCIGWQTKWQFLNGIHRNATKATSGKLKNVNSTGAHILSRLSTWKIFKVQEASELRASHGASGRINWIKVWFTPRRRENILCSDRVSDFHADFLLLVNVSNYPHHVSLGNVSRSTRSRERATIIDSNTNPQLTAKLICLRCCLHDSCAMHFCMTSLSHRTPKAHICGFSLHIIAG